MNEIILLLPFALPPPELSKDLLRAMQTPALAMLLGRGGPSHHEHFDPFNRSLPHEIWLARCYGLDRQLDHTGSPPLAGPAMRNFGLGDAPGLWFMLQPVHLHVARDHLVLTDSRQLKVSEQESRDLFAAAQPLFEEFGKALAYGDASTWFLGAGEWEDLNTATPDAACGHNIDIWMPQGASARSWRQLQNEVQMLWHTHPVNEAREARGLRPVNSVWIWGGGNGSAPSAAPLAHTVGLPGWRQALASLQQPGEDTAGIPSGALPAIGNRSSNASAARPTQELRAPDTLIGPALAGDWSSWLEQLHQLETDLFAPMLDALRNGSLDTVTLVMTDATNINEVSTSRMSLRKFWQKPSLQKLSVRPVP